VTVEETFSEPSPNYVVSSRGYAVRILGRSGLELELPGQSIRINSEMLAVPGAAVYVGSIPEVAGVSKDEILRHVKAALNFLGLSVQFIPPSV